MPDVHGVLTPDDRQMVRDWFGKHWKEPVTCPVCKTDNWSIADHVVQLDRFAIDRMAAPAYSYVMVTCLNCHHTLFFNAVAIGITPKYSPIPLTDPYAPPQPINYFNALTTKTGG